MERRSNPHVPWAVALAVVAVVGIVSASALYVFHSLRSLPGEVVDGSLEVAGRVRKIAAAFREGSVETTFFNYASRATASTFLQIASLEQVEVYTRKEQGTVLWGQFALPDVVVTATVPVEYTFYLDLEKQWDFRLEESKLLVFAPSLDFNSPSLDVSALHFDVRESSPLRDEDEVVQDLRAGLTMMSRQRAADHIDLIRETARRQVRDFVATWMTTAFSDADGYSVEVVFADERNEWLVDAPSD